MHILVADDHPLFAAALQTLFERNIPASRVTAVADLAAAHRALAGEQTFDLAILDLNMPGGDGLDGIRETVTRFPAVPIVIVSGETDRDIVARALALGARGFLPKTLPIGILPAALQVVLSGGTYVPAEYVSVLSAPPPENRSSRSGGIALTPREAEVLGLLVAGQSNKEIGRALDMQEVTVKLHARNIFRKLGVRNRVEATNAALKLGITPAPVAKVRS